MGLIDRINKTSEFKKLEAPIISPGKCKSPDFKFRILPYKYQAGNDPFIEVWTHNNLGEQGNQFALCPEKMFGEECPYCAKYRELTKTKLDKEVWKEVTKKFQPKVDIYVNGYVRGEVPEFYFMKVSNSENYNKEIIENILTNVEYKELFNVDAEAKFIEIWNMKNGLNLKVRVIPTSESGQSYPKFAVTSELKMTPVASTEKEKSVVQEAIKNQINLVEQMTEAWGAKEKIDKIYSMHYGSTSSVVKEEPKKSLPIPESDGKSVSTESIPDSKPAVDDVEYDEPLPTNDNNEVEESAVDDDFDSLMSELQK